jgi:hypothetical protein
MERNVGRRHFRAGDCVVFRSLKHTTRPGRRAKDVHATENGDYYDYFIDKCWVVVDVRDDGQLLLRTRRGKSRVMKSDDANLRHATIWDRLRYRRRFAELTLKEQVASRGTTDGPRRTRTLGA